MAFTENPEPRTQNPNKNLRIFLTGVGGQGTLSGQPPFGGGGPGGRL